MQKTELDLKVYQGDCIAELRKFESGSVDSIVTDPPYGLSKTDPKRVAETIAEWAGGNTGYTPGGKGFMGQAWDAFVPLRRYGLSVCVC